MAVSLILPTPNLAARYLRTHHETVADWEGCCGELANQLLGPDDHMLYVECDTAPWRYHMAMLRDGLVHDAWCKGPALTIHAWLVKMFGGEAEVDLAIDGETVFVGAARDYVG